MTYRLEPFRNVPLDQDLLAHLIEEHERETKPRLDRLWRYFRNELAPADEGGGSRGWPGQAVGLPERIARGRVGRGGSRGRGRRGSDDRFAGEIVIENDIAWRVQTLVDFMFPSEPRIASEAREPRTRRRVEAALKAVFDANGGVALWQDAALLGGVYGSVDFLVNADALFARRNGVEMDTNDGGSGAGSEGEAASNTFSGERLRALASLVLIEAVEAPRTIPLLNPSDYRRLDAYVLRFERPRHAVRRTGFAGRMGARFLVPGGAVRRDVETVTIIHSATHRQTYRDERLVEERRNRLGRIPVVHVQNLSQPLRYHGLSDVEPLIPLQDELNTRLSDRAYRVTMQSFRMWLGKGIEGFTDRPIGPGQMWLTENLDASIEPFGGDEKSPSEAAHVEELREALDKASGVTPAAAGHIKAKIGNLTSENALRVSLMGTIAKIKRKRVTYGRGIEALCELVLAALDASGAVRTEPRDRGVSIVWPDPLPSDETRRIENALKKAELGVPAARLRAELGYPDRTEVV